MRKSEYYVVKLSIPPNTVHAKIPYKEQTFYERDFSNSTNILKLLNKPDELKECMIIRSCRNCRYVRETLTGIKIPILYYSSKSFIERDHKRVTVVSEKTNTSKMLPYYIEAFETKNTYCSKVMQNKEGIMTIIDKDFQERRISNFNKDTKLLSLPKEQLEEILKQYNELHPDREVYRKELLKEFENLENRLLEIKLETDEKEIEKQKKLIISRYLK